MAMAGGLGLAGPADAAAEIVLQVPAFLQLGQVKGGNFFSHSNSCWQWLHLKLDIAQTLRCGAVYFTDTFALV